MTDSRAVPEAEPELPPGLPGGASPRPGMTYRMLRAIWRGAARLVGARLELEGAEHLPRDARGRATGGWIAAVVPHRTPPADEPVPVAGRRETRSRPGARTSGD